MNTPEISKKLAITKALREEEDKASADRIQFLVFQAGKGFFGINIVETHEILKPVTVTRLPNVEPDVMGVINLRGNIIPVIDVNRKFQRTYTELSPASRIVVCMHEGKYLGLIVDRVVEVARILEDEIEGAEVKGLSNQFVRGVGRSDNRLFLILNLKALVAQEQKNVRDPMQVKAP